MGVLCWLLYNLGVLGVFVFLFNSTGSLWSLLILLVLVSYQFEPKEKKRGKYNA